MPFRRRSAIALATVARVRTAPDGSGAPRRHRNQVPDVGHHPGGTGFDEEVVIELVDVGVYDRELIGEDAQQALEKARFAVGAGVAFAVYRRQQVEGLLARARTRSRQHPPADGPAVDYQ